MEMTGEANEADLLRNNMARLLKLAGEPGKCRSCGADVVWVRHRNGTNTPYNADGSNHLIECRLEKFRKFQKQNNLI